tara:strand:+ start:6970 stop:7218 length:249 start_codon:yes stop_codon:yes gene_type:complete
MEPRSEERGKIQTAEGSNAHRTASMEPRSEERGKLPLFRAGRGASFASMEPRSEERGKTDRHGADPPDFSLQWSRAPKSAER